MPSNINDLFESVPDDIDVYSKDFLNGDLSEYAQALNDAN